MGKIIMIGAMKGGVGKSVTAFNLAYSLQKRGKKVLAVDFDPQSNLTTCFGAEDVDVSIGDLMMNVIEDEEQNRIITRRSLVADVNCLAQSRFGTHKLLLGLIMYHGQRFTSVNIIADLCKLGISGC